jgi:starch-binding outer membrane protein, SusD/RagB family
MRLRHLMPVLLLAAAPGCDSILDVEPVDRIPLNEAITSGVSARAALVGAYDALQSLSYYGRNFLVVSDLSSDNADHHGTLTALGDVDRNELRADNTTIAGVWAAIYRGIGRVNFILDKVPGVPGLTDAERKQILGEAHFLRALHYHNLVKYWDGVPMPLHAVSSPDEAAAYTRASVAEVYAQILSDLSDAQAMMGTGSATLTASLGAVHALRSRVMLYMGNWQGTIDAAQLVYARGYTLAPTYASLFTAEGTTTPEDIFRVHFTAQDYNELGYYYRFAGRWETAPTANLYGTYETGDARFTHSVRRSGSDYESRKFPTTVGAEDLHVIRLAEEIHTKAAAHARLGQLDLALTEYNKVRARSGLTPHVLGVHVTTQQQVLAAIWKERRLELALEGDRFAELYRTGLGAAVLGLGPDRVYQLRYPIPAAEREIARDVTQNPGYQD